MASPKSAVAVPVLVNAGGGTATAKGDALADELRTAFDAAGLAIDLRLLPGREIAAAAAELAARPLVVVGGGDGTLGSAAGALVEDGATLGILPLGTRNHLAGELGIPADLAAAAKLIADGPTRPIDLGQVNGAAFVNNASVGFYPQMVRERENIGLPKKLAAIPAAVQALRRIRHHRLRLTMPGETHAIATPLLFVGNGRYLLEAGRIGEREGLDDGELSVLALPSRSRLALIGLALRIAAGSAHAEREFAAIGQAPSLTVEGRSRHLDVALDGEVRRMTMPLRFSLLPGALRVVAPLERAGATA